VRSQFDAAARRDERLLDLRIEFVRYKSGTSIVQYGGLWDRATKDFVARASRSMIFELHGAQVEAILLFDHWLDEHYRGPGH
jgi:hypothetical protein